MIRTAPRRWPSLPGRRALASATAMTLLAGGTALAGLLVAPPAQAALDTTLYAVANNVVYTLDENSGTTTPVSGGTLAFNTAAAARQPGSNLIYYYESVGTGARVGTYDVVSHATATLSATINASLTRLAFRSDGQLYGMSGTNLYRLDTTTGTILASTTMTPGSGSITGGGDMAFLPTNRAYIVSGSNLFYSDAPYTSATLVGPTTPNANAHPNLAFGAGGRLWTADNVANTVGYLSITTGAETATSTAGVGFTDMASSPDQAPVVSGGPTVTTPYLTPVTVPITSYVSDADGDPVSVVPGSVTGPHGTGSIDGSGNPVFTPAAGYSGPITVTYQVTDGVGGFATGTIDLTVGDAAPAYSGATSNTTQSVARGTGTLTPLVASDPNTGDTLTYSVVSGSLPAGVTLGTSTGAFTGSPTTLGSSSAVIRVDDGQGMSADTTLAVTVTNQAPSYTGATTNTAQTVAVGGTPAALAATDPNGDALTYSLTTGPLPAGITLNSDGTFSGTTSTGGSYPVAIQVADPFAGTSSTSLTITVPNVAPAFTGAATNTAQTVAHGTALTALAATDANGDTIGYTVSAGTLPTGVTLNSNGTWAGAPTQLGSFPLTVRATDPSGAFASHALTITVTNAAPALTGPATQTVAHGATPAAVTATDPEGDAVTYAITSGSVPGATLGSTGSWSGATTTRGSYPVTVLATDSYGATASRAYTITVPNAVPVFTGATGNTAQGLIRGETPAALVSTDADGDTVTYSLTSGTLPTGVTLDADGTFAGATTADGSFPVTITADDGHGGSVVTALTLTVSAAGAPTLTPDSASTAYGTAVSTSVLGNDSDPHLYPLTVTSVSRPAHGTAVLGTGGTVVYTPAAGFSGADSYTYTADNGNGGSATATVTVTVA